MRRRSQILLACRPAEGSKGAGPWRLGSYRRCRTQRTTGCRPAGWPSTTSGNGRCRRMISAIGNLWISPRRGPSKCKPRCAWCGAANRPPPWPTATSSPRCNGRAGASARHSGARNVLKRIAHLEINQEKIGSVAAPSHTFGYDRSERGADHGAGPRTEWPTATAKSLASPGSRRNDGGRAWQQWTAAGRETMKCAGCDWPR